MNDAAMHRDDLAARIRAKREAYNRVEPPAAPTPCTSPQERWSVAHTAEGMEASTARRLRKLGYEVYLPRLIEMRKNYRSHRGKRRVLVPLFLEYVFVKINLMSKRWSEIGRTIGVEGLLLAGDVPGKLPDEFIEILARRYREEYGDDEKPDGAVRHAKKPVVGASVQITDGPFKFFDATVSNLDKFDSQARIGVLLSLLGGTVPLELDADSVEQL